jgi:hypothetical protein
VWVYGECWPEPDREVRTVERRRGARTPDVCGQATRTTVRRIAYPAGGIVRSIRSKWAMRW